MTCPTTARLAAYRLLDQSIAAGVEFQLRRLLWHAVRNPRTSPDALLLLADALRAMDFEASLAGEPTHFAPLADTLAQLAAARAQTGMPGDD